MESFFSRDFLKICHCRPEPSWITEVFGEDEWKKVGREKGGV